MKKNTKSKLQTHHYKKEEKRELLKKNKEQGNLIMEILIKTGLKKIKPYNSKEK